MFGGIIMKKRLYKIEQGRKLDGVCGGIAEYFDIDPTLIRLACRLVADDARLGDVFPPRSISAGG